MASTTTAHTEVPGGKGDGHSSGFPPFDASTFPSQILWLAITFGFFWWLMAKKILPRIGEILETRRDQIARDLETAQALKDQTEKAIAGYEKALADARAKAQSIAAETRAQLNAETDAKRRAAEAELTAKLASAEADIGAIKAKALGEVGGIAADTAEAVIERLIGAGASKDEITMAVANAQAK